MSTLPGARRLMALVMFACGLAAMPAWAHADDAWVVSRYDADGFSLDGGRTDVAWSMMAGAGQLSSQVPRQIPQALGFGFDTSLLGLAFGPTNPDKATLDYGKFTYLAPGWLQGSFNWFGLSTIKHYDEGSRELEGGIEFLPLNSKFLASPERGYVIYRPTLALQGQLFALRVAPMGGRGYGLGPGGGLLSVGFAGFNVGIDGKLSSSWLTGWRNLRIQSGASIDAYEDLTGHLGQVGAAGIFNNDTMTGLAYVELVIRTGKHDELALGWKGSYDRLSPYDPGTGVAARNEDTAIGVYLRWSGGVNVGSPAAGNTI